MSAPSGEQPKIPARCRASATHRAERAIHPQKHFKRAGLAKERRAVRTEGHLELRRDAFLHQGLMQNRVRLAIRIARRGEQTEPARAGLGKAFANALRVAPS